MPPQQALRSSREGAPVLSLTDGVPARSSFPVGLITIGHALVNRRGLYRSARIPSGKPVDVGLQAPGPGRPKRGFARVVALAA
ncbi:MAG: hypothetical protein MUQ27_11545, partial [Acidimicrobiia bacterium]|nr:hypothetical protein [Acidimicrobiia bacterium]